METCNPVTSTTMKENCWRPTSIEARFHISITLQRNALSEWENEWANIEWILSEVLWNIKLSDRKVTVTIGTSSLKQIKADYVLWFSFLEFRFPCLCLCTYWCRKKKPLEEKEPLSLRSSSSIWLFFCFFMSFFKGTSTCRWSYKIRWYISM